MSAAILSNHRKVPPFGLAGGGSGECGDQWVERSDGSFHQLRGCDSTELAAGDIFSIQTPTGGGYGAGDA
jgi:5-oxoprolinase (ATP-hydrolysing)